MLGNFTRRAVAVMARSTSRSIFRNPPRLTTAVVPQFHSIPAELRSELENRTSDVAKRVEAQSKNFIPRNVNLDEDNDKVREGLQKSVNSIETMMAEVAGKAEVLRASGEHKAAEELENLFIDLCDKMKVGELETQLNGMRETVKTMDAENFKENIDGNEKGGQSFSSRASEGAKKTFSKFGQSFRKAMKLTAKVTAASMIMDFIYSEVIITEKAEEKLKQHQTHEAYKEVAGSYYKKYAEIYEEIYQDLIKDLGLTPDFK